MREEQVFDLEVDLVGPISKKQRMTLYKGIAEIDEERRAMMTCIREGTINNNNSSSHIPCVGKLLCLILYANVTIRLCRGEISQQYQFND